MSSNEILPSFVGALQASVVVLLTIGCGTLLSRLSIIRESSASDLSRACVRIFLPALLITNVGSELHLDTASRYIPVLIWALVYTLSSMGLGWVLKRAFKWPQWAIPAICFNNTTALPLLLIQSLASSGILDSLTMGGDDTSAAASSRAKSYFLISSIVSNSLTFAVGPTLLDAENAPDSDDDDDDDKDQDGGDSFAESDEEHAHPTNSTGRTATEQEQHETETTTLLPKKLTRLQKTATDRVTTKYHEYWAKLPPTIQKPLSIIGTFVNPPSIGALIGIIIGLTPALHRAFSNKPTDGGIFKAWLFTALEDIGELFATLSLVVVGVKLSGSLVKMKRGQASGAMPLVPMFSILLIRFVLWPILSIAVIYLIASKTNLLYNDPTLWFVLMLLPTGPPATKLSALAEVSGASPDEKMAISKFIMISYVLSPVISLTVVGALLASHAVNK